MHPDRDTLTRFVHGEIGIEDGDLFALEAHVASCDACRGHSAQIRGEWSEVFAALELLDDAPPQIDPAAVVRRSHKRRGPLGRLAAGIVLTVLTAGAVYAAPRSPIRSWVSRYLDPAPSVPQVGPGAAVDSPGVAGIVVPAGDGVDVVIVGSSGAVTLRLTDGSDVTVEADNGTATFDSRPDRLLVDAGASSPDVRVGVPRSAPHVAVFLGSVRVALIESGRITTTGRPGPDGEYTLR